jgi:hypothetical protein
MANSEERGYAVCNRRMKDLPSSKAHMTCKTLERLDIGVCSTTIVSETLKRRFVPWYKFHDQLVTTLEGADLRVRMCRSRCSSLVNDCPQYVQKTILDSDFTGHQWKEEDCRCSLNNDGGLKRWPGRGPSDDVPYQVLGKGQWHELQIEDLESRVRKWRCLGRRAWFLWLPRTLDRDEISVVEGCYRSLVVLQVSNMGQIRSLDWS